MTRIVICLLVVALAALATATGPPHLGARSTSAHFADGVFPPASTHSRWPCRLPGERSAAELNSGFDLLQVTREKKATLSPSNAPRKPATDLVAFGLLAK
jgi:hypothetical protein